MWSESDTHGLPELVSSVESCRENMHWFMGSCPYVWSIWSRREIVVRILTLILTQPICRTGIYPTLLMMLLKGKGCLSIACGNNNKHVKMFAYIYIYIYIVYEPVRSGSFY